MSEVALHEVEYEATEEAVGGVDGGGTGGEAVAGAVAAERPDAGTVGNGSARSRQGRSDASVEMSHAGGVKTSVKPLTSGGVRFLDRASATVLRRPWRWVVVEG